MGWTEKRRVIDNSPQKNRKKNKTTVTKTSKASYSW